MSESKSCNNGLLNLFVGTVFGLACGYAAGVLTAQKPGKDLRKDITNYSSDIALRFKDKYTNLKELVLEKVAEFKNFSDEKLTNTAKNIEELVNSLDEQLDKLTKKQDTVPELN